MTNCNKCKHYNNDCNVCNVGQGFINGLCREYEIKDDISAEGSVMKLVLGLHGIAVNDSIAESITEDFLNKSYSIRKVDNGMTYCGVIE